MAQRRKAKDRNKGQPMTEAQLTQMHRLIKKRKLCKGEIARIIGCYPNAVQHHANKLRVKLPKGKPFGLHRKK
jgi:hypothetical protein